MNPSHDNVSLNATLDYTFLLIFMHDVTILTQHKASGAATITRIEWLLLVVARRAPMASFWVRMVTTCMNIKRDVLSVLFTPGVNGYL